MNESRRPNFDLISTSSFIFQGNPFSQLTYILMALDLQQEARVSITLSITPLSTSYSHNYSILLSDQSVLE